VELKDIKKDCYVVYTELPFSDYANSLNVVVDINGILYPKPLCVAWEGEYIYYDDLTGAIPIYKYFDSKCWFLADNYNNDIDPIEYMNNKWPLWKTNV